MSDIKNLSRFQKKTHALAGVTGGAAQKKVLVLEDDPGLASLIRIQLEENGYEVDWATDGVGGIKKVMSNDYAVILCDMIMPNLSGDMFYVAVERVKPHLCRRFLFMTGHRGNRKIDEFSRRIKGLMLWKPFKMHVLMEAIHAAEDKNVV